jgi:hypothetical protein
LLLDWTILAIEDVVIDALGNIMIAGNNMWLLLGCSVKDGQ